ncbi:hypothetical protein HY091_01255, partial [Candidatus Kaiserbacteria bacterium]|nr:hypothetical protein [Candidatus Kaiserbacteria bacterium]
MDPSFENNFITTKQAHALSGYSPDYLARLARSQKLIAKRVGKSWVIRKDSLAEFLRVQGKRKVEFARALSESRETEYRIIQSPVERVKKAFTPAIPRVLATAALGSWRGELAAVAIALAVVGTGVALSRATTVARLATAGEQFSSAASSGFADMALGFALDVDGHITGVARSEEGARQAVISRLAHISPIPLPLASSSLAIFSPLPNVTPSLNVHTPLAPRPRVRVSLPSPEELLALVTPRALLGDAKTFLAASVNTLGAFPIALARSAISADVSLVRALTDAGPNIADAVFSTEYLAMQPFVEGTNRVLAAYSNGVKSTGELFYAAASGAQDLSSAALALTHPSLLEDTWLALLGRGEASLANLGDALRSGGSQLLAAVNAPALSGPERIAFFVYESIHDIFAQTTSALADLLVPSPTIVVLRSSIPTPRALYASSTPTHVVYPSPTYERTIIQGGVSMNSLNQALSSLRSSILSDVQGLIRPVSQQVATNATSIQQVNIIQSLSNLKLHASTIDNSVITSSTLDQLVVTGNATSTLANGVDITGGCFSINGTCFTGGAGSLATLSDVALTPLAYGDVLSYNGTKWNNIATSTLGVALSDTTGVLAQSRGGTGTSTYNPGDILYADAFGTLTTLPVGGTGKVLKVSGGLPSWGTDLSGSGGASAWATTSDNLAVYTTDPTQVVIIGNSATSTTGNILEVHGDAYFSNNITLANLTATGTLSVAGQTTLDTSLTGLLKAVAGVVSTATAGTDYVAPATAINTTYPLQGGGGLSTSRTLSLAFGTTTSNTWGGTQTFTNNPVLGALTGLLYGNSGTLATAATTT